MNHKLGVCSFSLTIFTDFFLVEIDLPTQRNCIIRLHLFIADKQVVTWVGTGVYSESTVFKQNSSSWGEGLCCIYT